MQGLLIAQALMEHGLLDSMAAGLTSLRYQVEAYVGQVPPSYLLVGVLALFVFLIARRRR